MSFTTVDKSTLGLYEASRRNASSSFMQTPSDSQFWGNGGPSFKSVLDTINPLQQLPVIGSIYRSVTGDSISTAARLAGGALFGGPLGFISALANTIVEGQTGTDIGGNVINAIEGTDTAKAAGAAPVGITPLKLDTESKDPNPLVNRAAYLAYSNATKLS